MCVIKMNFCLICSFLYLFNIQFTLKNIYLRINIRLFVYYFARNPETSPSQFNNVISFLSKLASEQTALFYSSFYSKCILCVQVESFNIYLSNRVKYNKKLHIIKFYRRVYEDV